MAQAIFLLVLPSLSRKVHQQATKTVTIIDSKFNYASANFTVTTPKYNCDSKTGPVGTTVTVTGSNFIANSNITINFDGNPIVNCSFTFNCKCQLVSSQQLSTSTSMIQQALNRFWQVMESILFLPISAVTPSITLNPTNGPIGSFVNVTGTGFAASQPVIVTFAGSTVHDNSC